jgi:superfamily II DNA or RNA helicase
MNFSELDLEAEYDSISHDVYNDFFNKVLSLSKQYARVGGIFTSRNFAACADGLQNFIQNDGKMKLVLTSCFNDEDIKAINTGIKNPEEILTESWIKDFSEIKDKFVLDHTKALAWMLANGYLEIKIVLLVDHTGKIVDSHQMEKINLFKRKTGIFWDAQYNAITFSGNIDFDDKLFGEYYYFRVYRSWDESEKKWVDKDYEEFQKYWEGKPIEDHEEYIVKTIPLPVAIKENLIRISPPSKSEIRLQKKLKLHPYQETALRNWINNGKKGIFEMATGTGKTFTAIGCIEELVKLDSHFMVIVVCPYDNLMRQWSDELKRWDYDSIITAKDQKWSQKIRDSISVLEQRVITKPIIIITSYATFSSDKFTEIIQRSKIPVMLIADEVHNAGASETRNGLVDNYSYRLGLSATFERYFDEEGTNLLEEYFGGTVFEYSLKEAIEKHFLVPYYYHPIYTDLIPEETIQYRLETAKIARYANMEGPEGRKLTELALQKRARIIRDAENKLLVFEDLIKSKPQLKFTLVYCSENQMHQVKEILNNTKPKPTINRQITFDNPKDPKDRMQILKEFAANKYQAIVANKVLDEGVDIPEARNCIVLASTGNPKQFIQRRGRVLRRFNGRYSDGSKKEFATIYDVLIVPELSENYSQDELKFEKSIIRSQLRRQETMASIAINSDECMTEIRKLKERFGIASDEKI